ncbi:hypothetical protein [Opitutus terrae]|uniref:Uncharacterized protein n=1 Tax=Opitutus terrae (strain DSM 11246 / JCM 15787 / PB90-1) TaxID=452637 RepID=B1ZU42_OPITP|nr:hypothetical protein [Opitutus terrae]ACB76608.1 hypothetical protein Oter_3330 [Opitutus terrae PB90-1]
MSSPLVPTSSGRLAFFLRLWPVFIALLLAGCRASDDATKNPAAFVVRIQPADFAAAELPFEEPLSRNYELVFLRTDFGQPVSALALRALPGGAYELYFGAKDAGGQWQKITTELEQDVGQQVLRAAELRLHRRIFVEGQRHDVAKNDGDLWVQQRFADGRIAAALIPFNATVGNPDAQAFVDDLLGTLQKLAHVDPADRGELLTRLDQIATGIILAETPQ